MMCTLVIGIVSVLVPHQSVLLDSPVATLGRYFSFWAGVPNSRMPLKPMDWWAPSVMPTPKSWLPTISTSRAYCGPGEIDQLEPSHPSSQQLMQPVWPASVPVCWRGQDRPGLMAPAIQRHPSPSGPPWCDPLLSPRHRFWQGRSLPEANTSSGRRVTGMSRSQNCTLSLKIDF